ncbi:DinB family protein [Jiulongibacter sp. NS-SX5]|uniref:DinB family protein n=1 Tax=Jiulongibacter sp. NS-SX5 TaxID=3463854 RepID=UPI00405892D0
MKSTIEITSAIKETAHKYIASLEEYSETDFESKQSEDIWSLGQMYDHIYTSGIYFFLANINRCLEKRKGAFDEKTNEIGLKILAANALPHQKFKRPGTGVTPEPESKGIDFYKKELPQMIEAICSKVQAIEKDDGVYRTAHPFFAYLNAKEWYQHFEIHMRHHLRQKAELEAYLTR